MLRGGFLKFLYLHHFAELSMLKPGEGLLLYVLAALLLPLRWLIWRFVESYFLWKLPLIKNDVVATNGDLIETALVIFATGLDGGKKIKKMFTSPQLQKMVMGSSPITPPLYRECIHPRIPQLAIIGYSESLSNLRTSEVICKWLGRLLGGGFRLPSIRNMEDDVLLREKYMRRYRGCNSSIDTVHTWYIDRLSVQGGRDYFVTGCSLYASRLWGVLIL